MFVPMQNILLSRDSRVVSYNTLEEARLNRLRLITYAANRMFQTLDCTNEQVVAYSNTYNLTAFHYCMVLCSFSSLVVFSMILKKFMVVSDSNLLQLVDPKFCLCEVVEDDTARPFLDFDNDVSDSVENIGAFLVHYFSRNYNIVVTPRWKFSTDGVSKRWHCIVSGIVFVRCWKLSNRKLAENLLAAFSEVDVDMSVYRSNSCLRLLNQYKPANEGFCRLLLPHQSSDDLQDITIQPRIDDFFILETRFFEKFHNSELSKTESAISTLFSNVRISDMASKVPAGFVMDSRVTNLGRVNIVKLIRKSPSYCDVCKRVHHKENAFLLVKGSSCEFRCFRNVSK